jgi:hypothetical protein
MLQIGDKPVLLGLITGLGVTLVSIAMQLLTGQV